MLKTIGSDMWLPLGRLTIKILFNNGVVETGKQLKDHHITGFTPKHSIFAGHVVLKTGRTADACVSAIVCILFEHV